ncbi:MAG TPA: alginate lyase family protein [Euzebyales bacterium]|nr:alginate lyase family protein [Euzebyales bacterium]
MRLGWYVRRLARMTPGEIAGRARDVAIKRRWRRRQVRSMADAHLAVPRGARARLPVLSVPDVDPGARAALLASADELLAGRWRVFADQRLDMVPAPDWFLDPRTGRSAPRLAYAFAIDHRDEAAVGNVKNVWELSRHTHCTVLAAAYHLTGAERYALAADAQLRSWWDDNPFLSGINWTSGIEVGLRLIAWTWMRRLLASWSGVSSLFDDNPQFLRHLHHHQEYLATFPARGSSANNHLIAEAAGLFTAAAAFPFFSESDGWRRHAAATLRHEVPRQIFPDGLHRELASEYHGFVLELALLAALEGEAQGHPLGRQVWHALCRMTDALAAVVDVRLRAPRQGDGDEGHGLLVDAPDYDRWSSLLSTGARLFGRLPWWPQVAGGDVRTALLLQIATAGDIPADRPAQRPSVFRAAGQVLLRDLPGGDRPELWCRFDAGPHGYLGIAAHAHADALSIEVREDGVDVLADPGTYAYHGDVPWRTYFRSTFGHSTLELAGTDQSTMGGGPFLWTRAANGELLEASGLDAGPRAHASGRHDGYHGLRPGATHHRAVTLDRDARRITVRDRIESAAAHPCRLTYHLGPEISCEVRDGQALLRWEAGGQPRSARIALPDALTWSTCRGQATPMAGWYSPGLHRKVPATTLVGVGHIGDGTELVTTVHFDLTATQDDGALLHTTTEGRS